MRARTYLGILFTAGVVVWAAFLAQLNAALFRSPVQLTSDLTIPVWVLILTAFLVGFLPTATVLFVDGVRRDLAARRDRREARRRESFGAAFRRAADLDSDGQWSRSLEELEPVLEAQPENFSACLLAGSLLRRLGRTEDALDVHRRAAAAYPDSVSLLYQLAESYELRDEPEVAREIHNRVLRDFNGLGVQVLRRRRNAALDSGDWDTATELQEQLGAMLGGVQADELREEADLQLGLDYQRGLSLLESEDPDQAAEAFQDVLGRDARFIPAAIMLGEVELVREDEEAALETWLEGYRQTGSPVFLQRIEDHFIEGALPRRAIETLRRLIAEAENDLLPRFFLGRLYYRLEMHDEALKVLTGLADRIGSSPTYHFLLGRIRSRRKELAESAASFETCARAAGIPEAEYRCSICDTGYGEWHGRCDHCGSWNSVELDFDEEKVSASELGLGEVPIPRIAPTVAAGDPDELAS